MDLVVEVDQCETTCNTSYEIQEIISDEEDDGEIVFLKPTPILKPPRKKDQPIEVWDGDAWIFGLFGFLSSVSL